MRLALLLLLAAGCEQTYIVDGKLSIDAQLAPPAGTTILVIVEGHDSEVAWSPSQTSRGDEPQAFAAGVLDYDYRYEEFGKSPHALYLAAFVDLDNDGKLGSGEPFGEFAGNPIIDAPYGEIADPSVADIAIDQVEP
jgi:hypothetical protein